MEELLKLHFTNLTQRDLAYFKKIDYESELPKIKPTFHLFALLFGWFYLLYRKVYLGAIATLIASLLIIKVGLVAKSFLLVYLGIVMHNILSGLFFHFLYATKFRKDLDRAKYPLTDKEELAKSGGTSFFTVILSIIASLVIFYPLIIAIMTGASLKS